MKKKTLLLLILAVFLAFVFRVWNVSNNPPGLYWDEVALGYDAYCLLKTGFDQHAKLPITFAVSFGDFKNPLYLYLLVPFLKVFGVNNLAVRLPSVLSGTFSVLLLFLFVKKAVKEKYNEKLALLSSFLLAINPWHIHFSRVAFEANIYIFCLLLSFTLFLYSLKKKYLLPGAFLFLGLLPYSYHSGKILFIFILIYFSFSLYKKKNLFKSKKDIGLVLTSFLLLVLMIVPFLTKNSLNNTVFRYQGVSDIRQVAENFPEINILKQTWIEKIVFNQRFSFLKAFIEKYLSLFDPFFLFLKGDLNLRHSTLITGLMYWFEIPLFLIGFYFLLKKKWKDLFVLLLLIGPLPSALTVKSPHALRGSALIIVLPVLTGLGIIEIKKRLKSKNRKTLFALTLLVFYIFFLFQFNYFYHKYYPVLTEGFWQSGYQEMVAEVRKVIDDYQEIYIDNSLGQAYLYTLFYLQYDPKKFQQEGKLVLGENGRFWDTTAVFSKFVFTNDLEPSLLRKDQLFVVAKDVNWDNVTIVKKIKNKKGGVIFSLIKKYEEEI
jgi:4-amino-4-deoxy-L-arabinose transferase-like glycosyltransferase